MRFKSDFVFPHETLSPILGDPNFLSLSRLLRELMANARSVPSTHWGGAHGHLLLVEEAIKYLARTGHEAILLVHPGPPPLQDEQTAAQIRNEDAVYRERLEAYLLCSSTENRLRNQLLEAVPNEYLDELQDFLDGFANVTVIDMLDHLFTNYGKISPQDREENRAKLLTAWSTEQPLASLWICHNEIREFAIAAEEPILPQTIMDQTIVLFRTVGLGKFQSAIDAWRRKPEYEKTYLNFKKHFTAEYLAIQLTLTASAAGFHQANAASGVHFAAAAKTAPASSTPTGNSHYEMSGVGGSMFYCWSHGLGKNATHTSQTCKKPKPGHMREATCCFPLDHGGSTQIHNGARKSAPATASDQA